MTERVDSLRDFAVSPLVDYPRRGWIMSTDSASVFYKPRKASDRIEDVRADAKQIDPLLEWELTPIHLRALNGDLVVCVAGHAEAAPYWRAETLSL